MAWEDWRNGVGIEMEVVRDSGRESKEVECEVNWHEEWLKMDGLKWPVWWSYLLSLHYAMFIELYIHVQA